jgi:hypothetical protein
MSSLGQILKELLNPTRLPWQRRPKVGGDQPCTPTLPRDPEPVRPPDPECTTGPDPSSLKKIFRK